MATKKTGNGDQAQAQAQEQAQESSGGTPEFLKKMSARTLIGDLLDADEVPKEQDLYSIFGICTGVKTGRSTYGEWTSFLGTFEAHRADNGKVYASGRCFLPEPVSSMLFAQLQEARKDDANATVSFALLIGRKKAKTATGYEYTSRPLVRVEQNDPLAFLRGAVRKALPAPTAA